MNVLTVLTILSVAVAVVMTAVVVRLALRERRRSAARVAALEADIYRTDDEDLLVLHDPPSRVEVHTLPLDVPEHQATVPVAAVVAVGVAVAFGMAVGVMRYRTVTDQPERPVTSPATAQALELLALDQQQDSDRLTVRGVVRNPPRGHEVEHLTAVVLLFNQQGNFLTSARSPVETAALEPGNEAKFVVTVPGASDVGKYRVSFRTDDRVVPHVDRR